MHVMIHDFGGHAFIASLSRELARRGYRVSHAFSASVQTPQGTLSSQESDPAGLEFMPIKLSESIDKYSFMKRAKQDREHADRLLAIIKIVKPDVIFSACTPVLIQARLVRYCRANNIKIVTWVQDLYGIAASRILKKRLGPVGRLIGRYFVHLDRFTFRQSDALILITRCFASLVRGRGVRPEKMYVIPNWASLDEIPVYPKDNAWSRSHGLSDKFVFLYSGTLAMKHNPQLLLDLARHFAPESQYRVVVVSEGRSADWLKEQAVACALSNLIVLPFQPFDQVPYSLASADVLLSILEPSAGVFCVPSKVLTYFCTGRPSLLAVPPENLAARTSPAPAPGLWSAHPTPKAFSPPPEPSPTAAASATPWAKTPADTPN